MDITIPKSSSFHSRQKFFLFTDRIHIEVNTKKIRMVHLQINQSLTNNKKGFQLISTKLQPNYSHRTLASFGSDSHLFFLTNFIDKLSQWCDYMQVISCVNRKIMNLFESIFAHFHFNLDLMKLVSRKAHHILRPVDSYII